MHTSVCRTFLDLLVRSNGTIMEANSNASGPTEDEEQNGSMVLSAMRALYDEHKADVASKPDCVAAADLRTSHTDRKAVVDKYIDDYAHKAGWTGAATGALGAVSALLAAAPEILALVRWQLLMVMHIAVIQGYELNDATFTRVALAASGVRYGEAVHVFATVGLRWAFKNMPARMILTPINRFIGRRFFTKAGQKGAINLVKWIPVVGAVVGGVINGVTMTEIGKSAIEYFPYFDCFLSHTWGKDEVEHKFGVNVLAPLLTNAGLKVWLDHNFMRGDLNETMQKAVADSKGFIACVSATYLSKVNITPKDEAEKTNCYRELEYHKAVTGQSLIVTRINTDAVLDDVRDVNWFQGQMMHDLSALFTAYVNIISPPPPPPPATAVPNVMPAESNSPVSRGFFGCCSSGSPAPHVPTTRALVVAVVANPQEEKYDDPSLPVYERVLARPGMRQIADRYVSVVKQTVWGETE